MVTAVGGAAAAAHGLSMPMIIGAIVVVIIVVAGGALLLTGHPSSHGNTSTVAGTTGGTTSVSGSTSTPSSTGQNGGGPGQWVMSDPEISAMAGTGGAYNSTGSANASLIATYATQYDKNSSNYFYDNVTGIYLMTYSINSSQGNQVIMELVFQSPKAQFLYAKATANQTSGYNVTNASVNGLTYDYVGAQSSYGNYSFGSTDLIGWKNQGFVEFFDIGAKLPQTQLAATVAGDIP